MKETEVYLNVREISEVHEKKVQLKDVAQLWCSDPAAAARLNALTIKTIRKDRDFRYVESVLGEGTTFAMRIPLNYIPRQEARA